MFRVYFSGEYETSRRCHLNGAYNLLVKDTSLCLCDLASNRVLYEWPHKYIRRYGKTHSSFHFEAGRRCPTGEGEFVMETNQCPEILRAVRGTWKTSSERGQTRGCMRSPDEEQRAAEGHTNVNIIGARQGFLDKNRSRDTGGVYSEPYSIDTGETYLTAVAEKQHYNRDALDGSRAGHPPKSDAEHIYNGIPWPVVCFFLAFVCKLKYVL
ncbi:docking protein 2-like [Haliotis rubra]|uniref:docking protein 2-like n=1 Tax=Haliotis rubra TaxID=36100 RepID=UPI001EE5DFC2|nr:docking protein 2-like [Haliotis rubra]